ncbi:hypothetical protein E2C01_052430 [Portunus trituberculatus]|uniref:Uncharacterized protein n=1 Tax=Portunus trituberculatus TaxID=210409 RepID=A0A5B7GLU7_PORTR|nr:hypothetical protein [Portunus trituberculatus]
MLSFYGESIEQPAGKCTECVYDNRCGLSLGSRADDGKQVTKMYRSQRSAGGNLHLYLSQPGAASSRVPSLKTCAET